MPTDTQGNTKGSNKTPSSRQYRCFDRKKMKASIEAYKIFAGTTRKVSSAVKSAIAYFNGGKPVQEKQS
jgi:hypothetical protein